MHFVTGIEQDLEQYVCYEGEKKNMYCVNWCTQAVMLKGAEVMVQMVECLAEALGSVSV